MEVRGIKTSYELTIGVQQLVRLLFNNTLWTCPSMPFLVVHIWLKVSLKSITFGQIVFEFVKIQCDVTNIKKRKQNKPIC